MENKIVVGISIIVGSAFIFWIVRLVRNKYSSDRIYSWLKDNTKDKPGENFRSTLKIANGTNLTEDRVHFLCSNDKRFFQNAGRNKDQWDIYNRKEEVPRPIFI